jgi:hypothetical protein
MIHIVSDRGLAFTHPLHLLDQGQKNLHLKALTPPAPVRCAHRSGGMSRILTLFPPLLWPKATGAGVRG